VLAAVKDASRRWWPEGGPSLTAAARVGVSRVQVGAEGWCRSNKRIGPRRQNLDTGPKSPTRFHEEAKFFIVKYNPWMLDGNQVNQEIPTVALLVRVIAAPMNCVSGSRPAAE